MNRDIVLEAYERGYRLDKNGNLFNPNGDRIYGYVSHKGYVLFGIRINNISKNLPVHRLQAYQKFRDKIFEPGIVVRHLNNNKEDNSWDNIEIGTYKDNSSDNDKQFIKSVMREVGINNRVHDYDSVLECRESGMSYGEISKKFGISKSEVYYICNRKSYCNHGKKFDTPIIIDSK